MIDQGVSHQHAAELAASWAATLAEVDSFRDDAGRVWARMPVFDDEGHALPFDRRNVAALEAAASNVLMLSPEAVAVFGGIVYPSGLSKAAIARVMWMGRAGEVTEPPDIFNSLEAVAILHEAMFQRLIHRRRFEQERVGKLLEEQRDLLLVQNAALRTQLGEEATDERPTDAGRPGAAGPGDGP